MLYTATYDGPVVGTPTAPTLTIGSETGITLTPVSTSGNTRSWSYTISQSGTADSGAVSVQGGNFLTGIQDAAGNLAAGNPTLETGTFTANANTPLAPTLTLGSGVSGGATMAEATQSSGVLTVSGESGTSVVVTFTDRDGNAVTSTPIAITASGSSFAVTLAGTDIGNSGTLLHDGTITVAAVATNSVGVSGSPGRTGFTLDTVAPVLQSLQLSSSTGSEALKLGDRLLYTATYDGPVVGTPTAPTLTIGSETGITLTPVSTSGNTRSWSYTISQSGTADSGAVSVQGGNFLTGIQDAAGNLAAGNPTLETGTFTANANTPLAPTLTLGSGVSGGATMAEATQSSGVLTVSGESGTSVVVTFTDRDGNAVTSTPIAITASGSSFAVTLAGTDIGNSGTLLHDGTITVAAVATNSVGVSGSPGRTGFTLDTVAPVLQSLQLSSSTGSEALKLGDRLLYTATYDGPVVGTPTAPTLTIGSETGITLTPVSTSGNTRSWSYTISQSGTADSGAVSVQGGNFLTGIQDAAGNLAAGNPTLETGTFTANANTPLAPTLTLGSGVSGGATMAEATQSSGVLTVSGESGTSVVVIFTDRDGNAVTSTPIAITASGSSFAVTLAGTDIGNSGTLLHDGTITVAAVATNSVGVSGSPGRTGFTLDTVAPVLQSLQLSSSTGSEALKLGDRLLYTATYDGPVVGTPTAPTLTIGSETGITLTPVSTSGNTRSWSYTISQSGTADSGAVSVQGGNFLTGIQDAAGNLAAGNPTLETGTFTANANTPLAPTLTLGSGVSGGATMAEATQSSGVLTVSGESGTSVVVTFTDRDGNAVTSTPIAITASGSSFAVTLAGTDIGNSGTLLHDGTITVAAVATNSVGVSGSPGRTGFTLDTVAPVLQSLQLSSSTGSEALKLGDRLLYTATYDGPVVGTPTAPTLTIGSETGITLTPVSTSGNTRSWSYTISQSGTADSGAVSVQGGNFLTGIQDAAGNLAAGNPTLETGTFTANANTPLAPTLTLGSGVSGGATMAEATQSSGVLTVSGESGTSVVVTFTDRDGNAVTSTPIAITASGSSFAVTLAGTDIGNSGTLLHDGTITVAAVATNSVGVSGSPGRTGFTLDTVAPVLQSLQLSSSTGSEALKLGDRLLYTATYDGPVVGTPTAPTLTIGSETGITLTPVSTSGNTRSWSYTISQSGTADSGAVSVQGGNFLTGIQDAAGNLAAGNPTLETGTFTANANTPLAPTLTLGSGVSGGATMAEATQSSGVLTVSGESGTSVVVTFTDRDGNAVTSTPIAITASGSSFAVTLAGTDIGNSGTLLHDGTITVAAVATNSVGVSGSPGRTGFTLDTVAPVLQSLQLSSSTGSEALKLGDRLLYTATYDGPVVGTPTAPTLTIGSETGITLTPVSTSGNTRSWSYTISQSGTADSGAVSVQGGNFLTGIQDAAGNLAAGNPTLETGTFTANANTPLAPTLTLGSGVSGGATMAEATQSSGVLTVSGESGTSVVVTFTDRDGNAVTSTPIAITASGSSFAVTLAGTDIGNSGTLLHDGTITVAAVATNSVGVSGSPGRTGFTLDTVAPVLQSLQLSSSTGSEALKLGDRLLYTATYDGPVVGTPTAPTLTIGSETGITLTPVSTSGNTRSWSYTISQSGTADSGAVSVQGGNFLTGIQDAAGNLAAGNPTLETGTFTANANTPLAPTLTLGSGVSGGATMAEATQSSGVLTVSGESGTSVVVTFTDRDGNAVTSTPIAITASGSSFAVTLAGTDIGNSGTLLHDGTITVAAVATNSVGVSGSPGRTGFTLDTVAPVLQSLQLSSSTGSEALKLGDRLLYTATYDGPVVGTPTAPTLTIGSETGITLTPVSTSGNTRSWSYTISQSGTADSGAVSVQGGNFLTGIQDAAGNLAAGNPTLETGTFTANANTPLAPTLTLGSGVSGGATMAEATQSSGVLTVSGESGTSVVVTFTDRDGNAVTSTPIAITASGSSFAVTLAGTDIGNSGTLLHDGTITVAAVATNSVGVSGSPGRTGFTLDTVAPVLQSLQLSSSTGSEALKLGDRLLYTATYDGPVVGTPTAPTLTIGSETGITLTPVSTSGNTRSWSYTISQSGTADSGAVSVQGGNFLTGIQDAAGNLAAGNPTLETGTFTANANTPLAPTLTLGSGVSGGATMAEATQSSGVLTVSGESGTSVVVIFTDRDGNAVTSTPIAITASGSSFAVTLAGTDIGNSGTLLHDGTITVAAVATNSVGVSGSPGRTGFTLDTVAPVLQSLQLSSSTGSEALKLGDRLLYTATYDGPVVGTPTAPTLTIGSETGITLTPVSTSGNTRSWSYTISQSGTADSGAVSVQGGNFLTGIQDAAGNLAAGNPTLETGTFTANANTPLAPTLTLGSGVSGGATMAEATQSSGVLTVSGESGTSVVVTFTDRDGNAVTSTPIAITASGSSFAVTLAGTDIGNSGTLLHDGTITVAAVATNSVGVSGSPGRTGFTLDTVAPVLQSLQLSSSTGSEALKLGDRLLYTATYDGPVVGTPTAPTLTIGSETGITLTPVSTSGNTRSWSYTISQSGTADSGAVSVQGGNFLTGIQDAAGNLAAGNPTLETGTFTANANTPLAPTLTLGSGVSGGATMAEATQSSGVLTVSGESGTSVVVTFTDRDGNAVTSTPIAITASGSSFAVTLAGTDIGNSGTLHDGTITVAAVATNSVGVSGSPGRTGFTLDTVAPVLQSLQLSSSTGSEALKLGDRLLYTATYDGPVVGTPTAPTLTIGSETGITLTPVSTSGNTRSWSYTISQSGTADSGAVSVQGGNFLTGIQDAAGNLAAGNPILQTDSFTANANTPLAPTLTLGSGVSGGATMAEATQSSGVLTVSGESGTSVVVIFTDRDGNAVTSTPIAITASGSSFAVTLAGTDIGNSGTLLHDGTITVAAVATNSVGVSGSPGRTGFTLDTVAPVLQSLQLSSSTGSEALKLGDRLLYTATYDGPVVGTPTAPTLTIGSETGITLTPVSTSGNTRSWSYTISQSGTADSGAVSVQGGNFLTGIQDAAGNLAAGNPTLETGTFTANANTPLAPTLTLGSGVSGGATMAEATQSSGVLTVSGESGTSVVVTFTDRDGNAVTSTPIAITASGSSFAVTLAGTDIGNSGTLLHDGTITVAAVATNSVGVSGSPGRTGFTLDTVAPVLQSLQLSSSTGSEALKLGDRLLYTATYDGPVVGTPTAPTLTIGSETGITLTPVSTSGNTRSWSYTISQSGTADSGAVSVQGGNFLTGIQDAAGNLAAGNPTLETGTFTANANTPLAPTLTLGSGVSGGATMAEATQSSGVLTVSGESGTSVVVTFTDRDGNAVTSTPIAITASGSSFAVTLAGTDIGNSGTLLHDGTITVAAVATNSVGVSGSPGRTGFTLDTVAPVLQSLQLSSSTGSEALKLGDRLLYTATYDGPVVGTPTAPTLTIGSETGITLTPVSTSGNTRSWSYTISQSGTADSGAVSVQGGNFLTGIQDAAGNLAAGNPTLETGTFTANANTPLAPTLTLGSGVSGGATMAEATQSSGVLTVSGESGTSVVVTFTDRDGNAVTSTPIAITASGSSFAVTLAGTDIGNSGTLLHDGTITVAAVATNSVGVSGSPGRTGFTLDTVAPVLQSLQLSSSTGSEALKLGDRLLYTATYDGPVVGTPTAPTLTIGSETGITLTPVSTSGNTRSWSYTISQSGTADSGAVSVQGGNFLTGIQDAAGNLAAGNPTLETGTFTANANTPLAPTLTLGSGVSGGATMAEATQSSGVLTVSGESGTSVVVTFTDRDGNAVTSTPIAITASGSSFAVTLAGTDIGNSGTLLHDGTITVAAVATNSVGVSGSPGRTGFTLDSASGAAGDADAIGGDGGDGDGAVMQQRAAVANIGAGQRHRKTAATGGNRNRVGGHGIAVAVGKGHHHRGAGLARDRQHAAALGGFGHGGTAGNPAAQRQRGCQRCIRIGRKSAGFQRGVAGSQIASSVLDTGEEVAALHTHRTGVGSAALADGVGPATRIAAGADRRQGNTGFRADGQGRCGRRANHRAVIGSGVEQAIAELEGLAAGAAGELQALQHRGHGIQGETGASGAAGDADAIGGDGGDGDGAVMQQRAAVANIGAGQRHRKTAATGGNRNRGGGHGIAVAVGKGHHHRGAGLARDRQHAAALGGFGHGGTAGNPAAQRQRGCQRCIRIGRKSAGFQRGVAGSQIASSVLDTGEEVAALHTHRAGVGSAALADGVGPATRIAAGADRRQGNTGFRADGQGRCGRRANHRAVIGSGVEQAIAELECLAAGAAGELQALQHRGHGIQGETGASGAAGDADAIGGDGGDGDGAVMQQRAAVANIGAGQRHRKTAATGGNRNRGGGHGIAVAVGKGHHHRGAGLARDRQHAAALGGFGHGGTAGNPAAQRQRGCQRCIRIGRKSAGFQRGVAGSQIASSVLDTGEEVAALHTHRAGVGSAALADGVGPATRIAAGADRRQGNTGFRADGQGRCGRRANHRAVIGSGVEQAIAELEGLAAGAAGELQALQHRGHGIQGETGASRAAGDADAIGGDGGDGDGAVMQQRAAVANIGAGQRHRKTAATGGNRNRGGGHGIAVAVGKDHHHRGAGLARDRQHAAALGGFGHGGTAGNPAAQRQRGCQRCIRIGRKSAGFQRGVAGSQIASSVLDTGEEVAALHTHRTGVGSAALADGVGPATRIAAGADRRQGNTGFRADGQGRCGRRANHRAVIGSGVEQAIAELEGLAAGAAGELQALQHRGHGIQGETNQGWAAGDMGGIAGHSRDIDAAVMQSAAAVVNLGGQKRHRLGAGAIGDNGFAEGMVALIGKGQHHAVAGLCMQPEHATGLTGFAGGGTGADATAQHQRGRQRGVRIGVEATVVGGRRTGSLVASGIGDPCHKIAALDAHRTDIGDADIADGVTPTAGIAAGAHRGQGNAGFGADGQSRRCRGALDRTIVGGGIGQHIAILEGGLAGIAGQHQALQDRHHGIEQEALDAGDAGSTGGIGGDGGDGDGAVKQRAAAADIVAGEGDRLCAAGGGQGFAGQAVVVAVGKVEHHDGTGLGTDGEDAAGGSGLGGGGTATGHRIGQRQGGRIGGAGVGQEAGAQARRAGGGIAGGIVEGTAEAGA